MGYRGKVRQIKTGAVIKLNVANLHCCDLPFKVTEHVRGCVAQNFIHGRVVLKKVPKPTYHFKAYGTMNEVGMFLSGDMKFKMRCGFVMSEEL